MSVPPASNLPQTNYFSSVTTEAYSRWKKISERLIQEKDHYFKAEIEKRNRVVYLLAMVFLSGASGYALGLPGISIGVAVAAFSVTLIVWNLPLFKSTLQSKGDFEVPGLNEKLFCLITESLDLSPRYHEILYSGENSFRYKNEDYSQTTIRSLINSLVKDKVKTLSGCVIKAPFEKSRKHILRVLKKDIETRTLELFPELFERGSKLLTILYSFSEKGGAIKGLASEENKAIYYLSKKETFIVLPKLDFKSDESDDKIGGRMEFDLDPRHDPEYIDIQEKISQLEQAEGPFSAQDRDFLEKLVREYPFLRDELARGEFLEFINLLIENHRFLEPLITTCRERFFSMALRHRLEESKLADRLFYLVLGEELEEILLRISYSIHHNFPTNGNPGFGSTTGLRWSIPNVV